MKPSDPNPFAASAAEPPHSSWQPPEEAGRVRRRYLPPMGVRVTAAAFLIVVGIVRWFNLTGDHAIVNIITFVGTLLTCLTLGIWFVFFSAFARSLRVASALVVLVSVVGFFSAMRLEHVSGELIPTFRPRWTKKVDETLRPAQPVAGLQADLTVASQDDFPEFLGPGRTNRIDHVQLAKDWDANPPRQLWSQPIGAGWSAFSAVKDFAVTLEQRGPKELVTCYEVATGKLVWSYATETRHETIPGGTGPRSTPTIAHGRVFALGATGELVCLDGSTGKPVWRTNLLEMAGVPPGEDEKGVAWGRSNSPLVVDDLVIVPIGGPAGGTRIALGAFRHETGELVWKAGDNQVSYSSPIVTTLDGVRQVVGLHEQSVSGHDLKTGRELWSFPWPGNSTQDANVSQPVPVGNDQLFLSKGYGRGCLLLQLTADGTGRLDVTKLWEDRTLMKTKFTNVVLHDGHVYGLSDGILECVEVQTGKRCWKRGRYGQGQILGVGDVLLVQAESGEVAMVAATPDEYREMTRFTPLDGKTWNNLCLVGKRLLTRNAEQAACYELP